MLASSQVLLSCAAEINRAAELKRGAELERVAEIRRAAEEAVVAGRPKRQCRPRQFFVSVWQPFALILHIVCQFHPYSWLRFWVLIIGLCLPHGFVVFEYL